MDNSVSSAINAALCLDWPKAVEINSQILKTDQKNLDCLNRLGKALLELGENKKAATIFRKVLKLDRYNAIAQKNLARTQTGFVKKDRPQSSTSINFLEEPGKTRLVSLVNLAPASVLLKQNQADLVNLANKRHTVIVIDRQNNYLGALPDDIGHRLSILLKGGNEYCAATKSVTKNSLVIFLRETKRAKRFANTPSFAANADYLSFVRDDLTTESTVSKDEDEGEESGNITDRLHHDEEEPEA